MCYCFWFMHICGGGMFTCECKYSVSPEESNESPGSSVTGSCRPAEIDAGTKICPLEQQALLTKS